MNIYVGNLPYSVSEDDLKQLFEEHGEVSSVKIINDRYTMRSKGFGFVEMPNEEEAQTAIKEMNAKEIESRNIIVNKARSRDDTRRDSRRRF